MKKNHNIKSNNFQSEKFSKIFKFVPSYLMNKVTNFSNITTKLANKISHIFEIIIFSYQSG